jgi:type IV pilus assembly protein PilM
VAFRTIGLEIGSAAVRACELQIGGEVPTLINYHEVQLPPGAVQGGEVSDRGVVIERLRRLWDEGDFSQNRVMVGVAGLRAIIREIQIPYIPDFELDEAVKFQAQDVIPFPPEKTLVSARVIADVTGPDGAPQRRVLLAAAHKDLVEPVLEVLYAAGLSPAGVDLSANALVRAALHALEPLPTPGAEAIVSVGSAMTTVVIHEEGQPTFVRSINRGGDSLTEAISASLDVPFQDAEAIKISLQEIGAQYERAAAAVRDALTPIISEVRSSIDYYNTMGGKREVQRIAFTGGTVLLEGFLARAQAAFRVPVTILNVLPRLDTSQVQLAPEDAARRGPLMSVAAGLALPERAGVKQINLIPPEIVEREQRAKAFKVAVWVGVAMLVLFIGLSIWRFIDLQSHESTLSADQAAIARLQREVAANNIYAQQAQQLKERQQAIGQIEGIDVDWPTLLVDLSNDLQAAAVSSGSVGAGFGSATPSASPLSAAPSASIAIGQSPSSSSSGGGSVGQLTSAGKPVSSSDILAAVNLDIYSGSVGYKFIYPLLRVLQADPMLALPSQPVLSVRQVAPPPGAGYQEVPVSFTVSVGVTRAAVSKTRAAGLGVTVSASAPAAGPTK